jgi:hypothetical protein
MDEPEFLRRLNEELSKVFEGPNYERVYAGPWWETPITEANAPEPPRRAWKCAVLQRRPEGGAEHWGHLFVITGSDGARAAVAVAQLPVGHRARFGDPVAFPTGSSVAPYTIVARPIAPGRPPRIVALAKELAARLGPAPPAPTPP